MSMRVTMQQSFVSELVGRLPKMLTRERSEYGVHILYFYV
jgi:hypothetical protein